MACSHWFEGYFLLHTFKKWEPEQFVSTQDDNSYAFVGLAQGYVNSPSFKPMD